MPERDWCSHGPHEGQCGYKYIETVRDDYAIFAPASGIVRDILVDTCSCRGDHE
jgi:hypothetical protein